MRKWTVHRQLLQVLTSWNPKRRLRPALGLDWFRLALRAIFEEQDQHEQNLRKRSSFTENRIHPSPTWYVCRCQRPVISLQKKRRGRWVGRLGGVELFKGFPPKMYPTDIPIPGGFLFLLYLFFFTFLGVTMPIFFSDGPSVLISELHFSAWTKITIPSPLMRTLWVKLFGPKHHRCLLYFFSIPFLGERFEFRDDHNERDAICFYVFFASGLPDDFHSTMDSPRTARRGTSWSAKSRCHWVSRVPAKWKATRPARRWDFGWGLEQSWGGHI